MPILKRSPSRWVAAAVVASATVVCGEETSPPQSPSGDAVIRAKAGDSEIVITTTSRLAGAIHSLTWNGKEFIDSFDHGRQLQSACSFNCAKPGEFWAECYNPTEAGSRADGEGPKTTSRLLKLEASGNELKTVTQAAFWLKPGEKSEGRDALNEKLLSDHLIAKHVRIGYRDMPRVLDYRVTFTVPKDERHTHAQFEALTGYMPIEFSRFRKFDVATDELKYVDDGPGEQSAPVVFFTESGSHAMGIYSPDQPSRGFERFGYGRFRFPEAKVVKWNCVFRLNDSQGIKPGEYGYRMFVPIGTLEDVKRDLQTLHAEFRKK